MTDFRVLHSGCDTIEIAMQGRASARLLRALECAKREGQAAECATVLDWGGETFDVEPKGVSGFSYVLRFGPEGEIIFIAHSERLEGWNIRVKVGALALVARGYERAIAQVWDRIEALGCSVIGHSVSRFDWAVDYEAPGFSPDPEALVCHWRTNVAEHLESGGGEPFEVRRCGRVITSLTIGRMPGRQVQVYDKRREVIDRRKAWWWERWGVGRETRVWRVEVRLGKRALKERYGVTTLEDLERCRAAMIRDTLEGIRYRALDQTDTNVSRQAVHPLWEATMQIAGAFSRELTGDEFEAVGACVRDEKVAEYRALMNGLAASFSYVADVEASADDIGRRIGEEISAYARLFPDKFRAARVRAERRMRFLESSYWEDQAA